MYVLGIETSCDETSVAVVKDGRQILSNEVYSSLGFHKKYGGVIPEIASRLQLETISTVAESAVKKAKLHLKDMGLVCFTKEPGLPGSLLVGLSFAKAVSQASGIPLLGVDHVSSHIYANFLSRSKPKLPFVALVVSGGHTNLFYVKDFGRVELLSQTQDDACGEAFDKVAKILGLGYPGGPEIEKFAQRGNPKKIKFNCSGTKDPLDFSFSGIKTAVLYYMQKNAGIAGKRMVCDIAASFQEAVIDVLIKKSLLACVLKKAKRLVIGGGVAANNRLREKFCQEAAEAGVKCYFPSRALCTDNAAMVAGIGYQLYKIRGGRRC